MEAGWIVVGVVLSAALGAGLVLLITSLRSRRDRELAQSQKAAEFHEIIEQLKTAFSALSREALSRNTDDFLKLARTKLDQQAVAGGEQLESKKKLIDAALATMNAKLGDLNVLTQSIDKDRRESVGVLKTELAKTAEATGKLRETTAQLREALANPQRRGQWGERMADDVLRLVGFVEGVNYKKQATVGTGQRPDFTFLMPKGLELNMDVKFPLDNYVRAIEAADGTAEKEYRTAFLRDVRKQVKEIATRAYIDPEGGTLDCVLLFIPNEQIYGYIHEHDTTLLDDSVKKKVVMCSPLTLYAVLSVVRQAVDNFRLEQASKEILQLLGAFRSEWKKYCDVVDKMGKALEKAVEQFESLQTTRTRMLERKLDRIEDLQQAKGLPAHPEDEPSLIA